MTNHLSTRKTYNFTKPGDGLLPRILLLFHDDEALSKLDIFHSYLKLLEESTVNKMAELDENHNDFLLLKLFPLYCIYYDPKDNIQWDNILYRYKNLDDLVF